MIEAAVQGTAEESFTDPDTGVIYSPDLAAWKGEIKTTRKATIPDTEEQCKRSYAEYIKQCKMYMVLTKSLVWKLIPYFHSVEKKQQFYTERKPKLRVYDLTLTQAELDRETKKLTQLSAAFGQALADDDPSRLPLCVMWKCVTTENGVKTPKCPWFDDCKPKDRHPDNTEQSYEQEEF